MYLGEATVPGAGSPDVSDISNVVSGAFGSSGTAVAVNGLVLSAQIYVHPAPRPRVGSAVVLWIFAMRHPSAS
jgi:hypothetical protein